MQARSRSRRYSSSRPGALHSIPWTIGSVRQDPDRREPSSSPSWSTDRAASGNDERTRSMERPEHRPRAASNRPGARARPPASTTPSTAIRRRRCCEDEHDEEAPPRMHCMATGGWIACRSPSCRLAFDRHRVPRSTTSSKASSRSSWVTARTADSRSCGLDQLVRDHPLVRRIDSRSARPRGRGRTACWRRRRALPLPG